MNKVEIYYFSGTGNSLHVAKELQKRIPHTTIVPVVKALKSGIVETSGDIIGLVFPVHAFTIPLIVEQFLKRVDLKSASYIFAFCTRLSTPRLFAKIDKLLREKGKSLDACFSTEMPENYIPLFEVPSKETIAKNEYNLQEKLDSVKDIIINKQKASARELPIIVKIITDILFPPITFIYHKTHYFNLEKAFYADSNCTSCGLCERICLSDKIKMINSKPSWSKKVECTYCFACIHYCPARAIQIRKSTIKRGRYNHPNVTADDIAEQK